MDTIGQTTGLATAHAVTRARPPSPICPTLPARCVSPVTSANFLIDSESRLRVGGMMNMPGMEMGDMKDMDHSKMKH